MDFRISLRTKKHGPLTMILHVILHDCYCFFNESFSFLVSYLVIGRFANCLGYDIDQPAHQPRGRGGINPVCTTFVNPVPLEEYKTTNKIVILTTRKKLVI